jgi:hypothetical protein
MHYATEADAMKYLTAEGWRVTEGQWICRACAHREDCERDGHQWVSDPLLPRRMCEHCSRGEHSEWIRQVLDDIDALPEPED